MSNTKTTNTYVAIRKTWNEMNELLGTTSVLRLNTGMSNNLRGALKDNYGVKMKTSEGGRLEFYSLTQEQAIQLTTADGVVALADKDAVSAAIDAGNEEWREEFPTGRFPRSEAPRYKQLMKEKLAPTIQFLADDTPAKPKKTKAPKAPRTKVAVEDNPYNIGDELQHDGVYYTVVKTTHRIYRVAPTLGGAEFSVRLKNKPFVITPRRAEGLMEKVAA